jgi:L-fuculose-phosphate aldolase
VIRIPEDAKRDMLQVCRRLYERRLVAGADGNVSVRLSKDHVLATPAGIAKGFVGADDLVVCDLTGKQLAGKRRITTEIKIHLAAYALREDVCAVVHAHPPFATAFAVAGQVPCEKLMPEAYIAVGKVALAPYGTPSTEELAEKLRPSLREHDAVLLANHGAMTLGRDVIAAYHRMEALEQLCHITLLAHQLGSANMLTAEEMAKLDAIRGVYAGAAATNLPCYQCGWTPERGKAAACSAAASSTLPLHGGPAAAKSDSPALERPTSYIEPDVHWPGNPPVWERPGHAATIEEAHVRDLTKRALLQVQDM